MRTTKRVKVKPHSLSRYLKAKCKELSHSISMIEQHLQYEKDRMNHYTYSLNFDLKHEIYDDVKHTDFCLRKSKARVAKWEKCLESIINERRKYELDLFEFRQLRHYFKQDIKSFMTAGDNDRFELYVKSKRHQQLLDKYPEAGIQ